MLLINESLNVELVNVKEAKANFSKTPSLNKLKVSLFLHATIVGLFSSH
jgi:hypothetical protein